MFMPFLKRMSGSLKRIKPLIPLLILAIFAIYTLAVILTNNLTQPDTAYFENHIYKFYLSLWAIGACTVCYFFARRFYKYIIVITLLLGLFGMIVLSWYDLGTTYFIGPIKLKASAFLATFITFLIYYQRVFKSSSKTEVAIPQSVIKAEQEEIENFTMLYAGKSKSELGEIIDNGRYSNSAVEAAAALLRQKLKNETGTNPETGRV